jgi:integral membrane protein
VNRAAGDEIRPALLLRYRVMAYTTATLLIILVFVGIPLQFAAGRPGVVNVVGTMHGFLYLVYLYTAFELTRRLGIPKWQMALVLLAGTVPFCAFIAERKLTRRYESLTHEPAAKQTTRATRSLKLYAASLRGRWFSRRAVLLHLEVLIVAPACVAAGWWQATRALAGNELSWAYSVEWPVFALLAIAGWWHLIHEDPKAYRARRASAPAGPDASLDVAGSAQPAELQAASDEVAVESPRRRLAVLFAILVGVESVLGIIALLALPFGRPSGWLPARGQAVYVAHAVLGLLLGVAAAGLLARARGSTRADRIAATMGVVGVAIGGFGGLLTVDQSLARFVGIALMFVGPVIAGLGYLVPALLRSSTRTSSVVSG